MPIMDGISTTRAIQSSKKLKNIPKVIMATAYSNEEAIQEADDIQLSGLLSKPITASSLHDAILLSMGHVVDAKPASNRHEVDADIVNKLRGAKVLLVEDNEINQELANEILTSNGMIIDIADNGQIALDLLDKNEYDGVLMDCQMPVLDGYQATRQIRKMARFKNLSVIAMTANAMAGDREKVLAAGMNDHIAKPINLKDMFTTMAKWITPSNIIEHETKENKENKALNNQSQLNIKQELKDLTGIDFEEGLNITQGNQALYRKLLIKFKNSNKDFYTQFKSSAFENIDENDPQAATRLAHTLSGVAGNVGATNIQKQAKNLENACNSNESKEKISEILEQLMLELTPVLDGLGLLEMDEDSIANKMSAELLKSSLEELRALLEDDDASTDALIEKLKSHFKGTDQAGILNNIENYLNEYDFDEALEQLDLIKI